MKKSARVLVKTAAAVFCFSFICTGLLAEVPPIPSFPAKEKARRIKAWKSKPAIADTEFTRIDAHALKTPRSVTRSVKSLTRYLVKPARSEKEKVRVIARWIAANISYDFKFLDLVMQGKRDVYKYDFSSAGALKRRKTVCGGFAYLFHDMARAAGLNVKILTGWIKGIQDLFGGRSEKAMGSNPNHAWNAVLIDGRWHLMDLTCLSGGWGGKDRTFIPYFYLTPPDRMIQTHYPKDKKWQLLDKPLTRAQFNRSVFLMPYYFVHGLQVRSPEEYLIVTRKDVTVEITVPEGVKVYAAIQDARALGKGSIMKSKGWMGNVSFKKEGDVYRLNYQFKKPGSYLLYVLSKGVGGKSYEASMLYKCEVR